MPIKLNGTTIFNEDNFADKDLSNLSASGTQVINNAVSSAMSGLNYMKNINTTSGTLYVCYSSNPVTIPSNGWVICYNPNSNGIIFSMGGVNITIDGNFNMSFPVLSGTTFNQNTAQSVTSGLQIYFYPEVS